MVKRAGQPSFVGVWRLAAIRDLLDSGRLEEHPDFGPDVEGRLVYTASGHVSVNFMRRGRPGWTVEAAPTTADRAEAARGYGAYAGTFTVNEEEGIVVHHVDVALIPNRVGRSLTRFYTFEGTDRLILRPPVFIRGGRRVQRSLVWERIAGGGGA
jgi:hypothetical protein